MDCSELTWPLSAACADGMLDGVVWIALLLALAAGVCIGQASERQRHKLKSLPPLR